MAGDYCEEYPQVTLEPANAAVLPVEDDRFDAAVAALVYEYSPTVDGVVPELRRALRPGGQAAFISTDWESTVWPSSDADRMDRGIEGFTDIYANPAWGRNSPHISRIPD